MPENFLHVSANKPVDTSIELDRESQHSIKVASELENRLASYAIPPMARHAAIHSVHKGLTKELKSRNAHLFKAGDNMPKFKEILNE